MRYATMVELSEYRLMRGFRRQIYAACPALEAQMFRATATLDDTGRAVLKLTWFAIPQSWWATITAAALANAEARWLPEPLPDLPDHLFARIKGKRVKVALEHEKAALTGTPA